MPSINQAKSPAGTIHVYIHNAENVHFYLLVMHVCIVVVRTCVLIPRLSPEDEWGALRGNPGNEPTIAFEDTHQQDMGLDIIGPVILSIRFWFW